jgi:hypothetical protein
MLGEYSMHQASTVLVRLEQLSYRIAQVAREAPTLQKDLSRKEFGMHPPRCDIVRLVGYAKQYTPGTAYR